MRVVMGLHFLGNKSFSRTESLPFSCYGVAERKPWLFRVQEKADAFIQFAPHYGESEGIPQFLGRCLLLSSTQRCPSRCL